jgi:hypothetical protein
MKQSIPSRLRVALVLAGLALFVACGGGIDGTGGTPPPGQAITSSGVMTKGSVILNGVRFDDSTAVITDDLGRNAAQLANGMLVRLRGRSDDNVNGVADRIDVENEMRAPIISINLSAPLSFVAAGLNVLVDSETVFANVANFTALAVGMRVEVHGLRDANGFLHASRVEVVGAGQGVDELRGTVSALNTALSTFLLNGSIVVNYANATFSPAGANAASLANGVLVEVRGGNLAGIVFVATQVDIENLEDDTFRGRVGEKQEVEGFVTGFTAHPGTFLVNGRTVSTTANTRFIGGTATNLVNNAKVEASGVIDAQGVLVANEIVFR